MNGCNNCSKRRDIEKECPWGGAYNHRGEHGEHIGICNAYRRETNADRIRAMSDEELAVFLAKVDAALYRADLDVIAYRGAAVNDNLDWLAQPTQEDG